MAVLSYWDSFDTIVKCAILSQVPGVVRGYCIFQVLDTA